ncbi:hypothetical protein SpCBS45565_g07303 [Spizellomyces sp. 'palustris']|nr:hypothetical protein SpCBS45565_g07303 [Spizellomyces sp. 'palustris']
MPRTSSPLVNGEQGQGKQAPKPKKKQSFDSEVDSRVRTSSLKAAHIAHGPNGQIQPLSIQTKLIHEKQLLPPLSPPPSGALPSIPNRAFVNGDSQHLASNHKPGIPPTHRQYLNGARSEEFRGRGDQHHHGVNRQQTRDNRRSRSLSPARMRSYIDGTASYGPPGGTSDHSLGERPSSSATGLFSHYGHDSMYAPVAMEVRGSFISPPMESVRGSLPPPPRKNSEKQDTTGSQISSGASEASVSSSVVRQKAEIEETVDNEIESPKTKTVLLDDATLDLPFGKAATDSPGSTEQSPKMRAPVLEVGRMSDTQVAVNVSMMHMRSEPGAGAGAYSKALEENNRHGRGSPALLERHPHRYEPGNGRSRADSNLSSQSYYRGSPVATAAERNMSHAVYNKPPQYQDSPERDSQMIDTRNTFSMQPPAHDARSHSVVPNENEFTSMIFSGYLLKQNRHKRFQKRLFRFDGVLLICLSPKEYRLPANSNLLTFSPDKFQDNNMGREFAQALQRFYPTDPPMPSLTNPLVASIGEDSKDGKPDIWAKGYYLPKWIIPTSSIISVRSLVKQPPKDPEAKKSRTFIVRTKSKDYVLCAPSAQEFKRWTFLLTRMSRGVGSDDEGSGSDRGSASKRPGSPRYGGRRVVKNGFIDAAAGKRHRDDTLRWPKHPSVHKVGAWRQSLRELVERDQGAGGAVVHVSAAPQAAAVLSDGPVPVNGKLKGDEMRQTLMPSVPPPVSTNVYAQPSRGVEQQSRSPPPSPKQSHSSIPSTPRLREEISRPAISPAKPAPTSVLPLPTTPLPPTPIAPPPPTTTLNVSRAVSIPDLKELEDELMGLVRVPAAESLGTEGMAGSVSTNYSQFLDTEEKLHALSVPAQPEPVTVTVPPQPSIHAPLINNCTTILRLISHLRGDFIAASTDPPTPSTPTTPSTSFATRYKTTSIPYFCDMVTEYVERYLESLQGEADQGVEYVANRLERGKIVLDNWCLVSEGWKGGVGHLERLEQGVKGVLDFFG